MIHAQLGGLQKLLLRKQVVDDASIEYTGGDRGWAGDIPRAMLSIEKMLSTGYDVNYNSEAAVRHTTKLFNRRNRNVKT